METAQVKGLKRQRAKTEKDLTAAQTRLQASQQLTRLAQQEVNSLNAQLKGIDRALRYMSPTEEAAGPGPE